MKRSIDLSHFLYLLLLLILSILILNTNIYAATSTNLGTSYVSKQVYSIADFCEMFISYTALEQDQSCIAINEDSLSEELTTALEALSYMSSRATSSSENIEFIPVQDLNVLESKQYIIYIENLMDLPSTYKDLLTASEIAQAENEALLKLITTSSGQKVLILTGNNSTALINAGRMFGNEAFLSKLTSTSKFISEDENVLTPDTGFQEYYPLTDMCFESYPSPFIREHSFSNVITLIPDTLTSNDYAALSGIFRMLGHYLKNNLGVLEVKKVSEEYELADKNIIALGTLNENIYVSTLNSQLYYKFSMDGTTILPPENLDATEMPYESLGICQIIKTLESSDNELGYGILVVSGCSDQDVLNAASYLSSQEKIQTLYGNGYTATDTTLSCYRIKEDLTKKKIVIHSKLYGSKEFSLSQLTSKMLLVFLLLCTILLINKHRKRVVHEK